MTAAADYWKKRSLEDKKRSVNLSETYINREMKKQYNAALTEIQESLNTLYQAFADAEHISLQEAKKRMSSRELDPKELESLMQMLKENRKSLKEKMDRMPENVVAEMEKRLEDYEKQLKRLSQKGYITHLELSQAQIERTLLKLADQQQVNIYDLMEEQYRDGYFRGVFEVQQGLGFGKDFASPDPRTVQQAVMQTWSKRHFSENIWGQCDKLSEELKSAMTVGLIRGDSIDQMTKRVTRRLDVTESNARRLVRTESAYIHEKAGLEGYEECGIEEYQYLATLDRRTSPQCQELDGKVFAIKDAQTGVNYPPMHPNCRSTTVPNAGTEVSRRIARGADGKTYEVPASMTYKQWYAGLSEDEKGRMSLINRQEKNRSSDAEQYERYKEMLGAKEIGTEREFLKTKYGNEPRYRRLQQNYKEKRYIRKFKENLKAGLVNTKIQNNKQLEHMQGTKPWKNRLKQAAATQSPDNKGKRVTPQSFLHKGIDAQQLVSTYSGTGTFDYRLGSGTVYEYLSLEEPVGKYYNVGERRYVESKRICILYNNKGTHVFPTKEK